MGRFFSKSAYGLAWVLLVVVTVSSGCGLGSGALSSDEAKRLLLQLPYHYRWREIEPPAGASSALAGTAIGKHHTIVHFDISFGRGGFVFNDDLVLPQGVGKQFHTAAQWDEATTMVVEMEEKLCKATTGKPCSV